MSVVLINYLDEVKFWLKFVSMIELHYIKLKACKKYFKMPRYRELYKFFLYTEG